MGNATVVVTGGSAGIGHAMCARLLEQNYVVINLSRTEPVSSFKSSKYHFLQVDLSDSVATKKVSTLVASQFEVCNLINNVGATRPGKIDKATLEDLEVAVSLHLRCSLILTQAFLPTMRAKHFGRIINIASRAALGKFERSVYSATKAGMIGLARTWAIELAGDGITVNTIAPGPIATELFSKSNPPDSPQTKKIIDSILVKRMGTPDDVARAAQFFLDPNNGYVTGQVLYVCGGTTLGTAPV
jgi:3-oxoacyl-[acyl-carrier protein] reductase